jgi:hypothetical protein
MSRLIKASLAAGGLLFLASNAEAAFIIGAHSSEKGFANFTSTGGSASVPSAAVGLTGTNSLYGGNAVDPALDTYTYSYTPGTDVDNTVFVAGATLGSTTAFPGQGNTATGLVGGGSGLYNVYFTTPSTTGISGGGTDFTLTQEGAPVQVNDLNLNDGGTGPDTDPGSAFVGGANNAWYLLGTVELLAGNTYTVTQVAGANTFVSTRAHAVMYEAIPEPASLSLLAMGAMSLMRRRRATA